MPSLVLFLNKERSSNSSILSTTDDFELISSQFYRKITPSYTTNVRLDLTDDWTVGDIDPSKNVYRDYFERQRTPSEQILSAYYMAEYSVDGLQTFTPIPCMIPFDVTFDNLTSEMAFTNKPVIRSIYVKVSSVNLSTTERQQTLFTFTQNASTYLSSTAFAIEDVATKTLYSFIWGLCGITTEIDNLTSDVYYNVPSRVIFDMPYPNPAQDPQVPTVTKMVTAIYEKLSNFTELVLLTSASGIHIIQNNNDRFTYPVSAFGSVDSRVIYPLLSTGVQHFSMSAIFLQDFPEIQHVSYPSFVIDETTLPLTGTKINSSNFRQVCSANSFYGEGHTEIINLSSSFAKTKSTTPQARWLIGNRIPKDICESVNSGYYVDNITEDGRVATVQINTNVVNSSYTIPVHVMLLDESNYITTKSPIITYDDYTGIPSFYPFFSSSANVDGDDLTETLSADPFRKSIEVMSYPVETQVEFKDPFFELYDTLPYNFDAKRLYSSVIFNPALTGILTETVVGTQWKLKADSLVGSWTANAVTGPNTRSYVFELSYDKDYNTEFLPPFKASPIVDTSLVFEASCTKLVKIDFTKTVPASTLPPEMLDWKEKTTLQFFGSEFNITRPLTIKPYTKSYYNLKNVEVLFKLYSEPREPFILSAVELTSQLSQQTLKLTPQAPTGNIVFNRAGLADMYMKIYLYDTTTDTVLVENVEYLDCLEILEEYDIIDNNSFNSTLTPLSLTYKEAPLLSPNEWLIDDTVNDSIKKIYTIFEEINEFTTFYEKRDKLFGWFGLSQTPVEDAILREVKYTWQDLECVPVNGEEDETLSWFGFECNTPNATETTKGFKWSDHECIYPIDPSCMQRHCLEWSWKKRKQANSAVKVTWGSTKQNGLFEKRWKFEKCELDSDILNCGRLDWNIAYLNPKSFPLPYAGVSTYCKFIDIEYLSEADKFIVAHEREIRILNNDLITIPVSRRGIADELFSFQKIVGIAASSSEKIYVLDQILPRVCVFGVVENEIVAIDSWGDYGLVSNPTGFNKPTDIHIDRYDYVWITDNGNKCVKKYTATGKPILTLTYADFEKTPPLSVCLDIDDNLHVLTSEKVIVFTSEGVYQREYNFQSDMVGVTKINTNFNREMIYISYLKGVAKYFKNGKICHFTIKDYKCSNDEILTNFGAAVQDKHRNLYVIVVNKVLKFGDVMRTAELKGTIPQKNFWTLNEILINKEEYVQPWVYLKSFHRLWDNIELLRSSLFFEPGTCKEYVPPVYDKTDLIIGQNEIVTNAVLNRLISQLWENLKFFINYFNPNCKK